MTPPCSDEGMSPVASVVTDAAFDDLIVDAFARVLKQAIANRRGDDRSRSWSATTADLSASLHAAVAEGDPLKIAAFALLHWHRGEAVSARPPGTMAFAPSGERVRPTPDSRPNAGRTPTPRAQHRDIDIDGWPEEPPRVCRPCLEPVDFATRSTSTRLPDRPPPVAGPTRPAPSRHWIPAGRAAHESGVDLDVVRAWAKAEEIEHREDAGMLLVDRESIIARAHRYWRELDRAAGMDRRGDPV